MDWTPGGVSSDIEDRRDDSGGGGGYGFGSGGGGGGIGIIGFVILLVVSLVTGHNFLGSVLSGGGGNTSGDQSYSQPDEPAASTGTPRAHPAGEDRDVQLISFVLDDAQKTWTGIFQTMNKPYRHAKLVRLPQRHLLGLRHRAGRDRPVLLPAGRKDLHRPQLLGRAEEVRRLDLGVRPGLRHRPRARPPHSEAARHRGQGDAPRTAGLKPAQPPLRRPRAPGRLLRRRVGAFDRAARHRASRRHHRRALRRSIRWRRPPAEDGRPRRQPRLLHPRLQRPARTVVPQRAQRRHSGLLQDVRRTNCTVGAY